MKNLLFLMCLLTNCFAFSQSIHEKLSSAYEKMEADSQMKHATISLYVVDGSSGEIFFAKNEQVGLAPASCQKIFTSIAAFELLGHDYKYRTSLGYDGKIEDLTLKGNLHVIGTGDPTLGSWRWNQTKDETVLAEMVDAIKQFHISKITGDLIIDDSKFSIQPIPDGWIWEDIGNYYGAGCWGLNWHENQYDLVLKTGSTIGDDAGIGEMKPEMPIPALVNQLKTGEKGSGDNAYIYLPPYSTAGYVSGTIPLGESNFQISGAIPNAPAFFGWILEKNLEKNNIRTGNKSSKTNMDRLASKRIWPSAQSVFYTHYSPTLDSINYWFLQKSINLYGEAFLKTIAFEKKGYGDTEKGIALIKDFWSKNGIESSALNILDGSGLSPQNRITTQALVKALQFAKTRTWFNSFYKALPETNGMKMKTGSIGGAKSFAGYQKSSDGKEYVFAFIVNNYDGPPSEVVHKMRHILESLK